ncbi:hypothetical protein KIW84_020930 [Lathyrus oleraceus]|uniref:Uncharacterized protein n=1 Tax=Pisum sativum TaxID=3888 RepID=A0A9D4Y6G9_PEA|nr:hypothetical protein KIW84_020930 [Pisum sativum]
MERNILDAASGGALVDKTPAAAKSLIEKMSLNSQQFTTRDNFVVQAKGVNEIQVSSSNKALETKIDELTSLVKQLMLPLPPPPPPYNPPQVTTFSPSEPSLEELVKQMVVNSLQFQQQIDYNIQTLQTQIGQLSTSMSVMQQAQGSNQLHAQTVVNPKGSNGDSVNEVVYVAEALDIPVAPNIPSIEQPHSIEPKPLPKNSYYSSKLQLKQKYKKRIGWTLDDTRDIIHSICMHKISLKDEIKVVRQPRNPLILDIVKKEITFTRPFNT